MSAERTGVLPAERVRLAVDATTEPFWQAAREDRLVACRCSDCGAFRMPPTTFCPTCRSRRVEWPELSGRARIFSFTVARGFPGLPDLVLVPAVVDLLDAPGARLVSDVVDVAPADVHIGMELTVCFSPAADGWKLPLFRPVAT